jgi:hypothetical protein
MTQRSRYDELHDRYHALLTTKAGTRYEMLAAMVFKILEDKNIVIHDLKLVGDGSEEAHPMRDQKSTRHGDGGKPRPVSVFVSGLTQMSVTLQAAPASVAGHRSYLWDRPTHLEQS